MLSQQTIEIVKSTAPLLAETGPKLTAHFYDRLFRHNPELKDIFNMSNQRRKESILQQFKQVKKMEAELAQLNKSGTRKSGTNWEIDRQREIKPGKPTTQPLCPSTSPPNIPHEPSPHRIYTQHFEPQLQCAQARRIAQCSIAHH